MPQPDREWLCNCSKCMQGSRDTPKPVSRSTYFAHRKAHEAASFTTHTTHTQTAAVPTQSTRETPLEQVAMQAIPAVTVPQAHNQNFDDDDGIMETGDDEENSVQDLEDEPSDAAEKIEFGRGEITGEVDNHMEDHDTGMNDVCILVYLLLLQYIQFFFDNRITMTKPSLAFIVIIRMWSTPQKLQKTCREM